MTLFSLLRIEFSIIGIIAVTYIFPVIAALCYKEYSVLPAFLIPMAAAVLIALVFFITGRKKKIALSTRGAFVVVAFAWILASVFGSLPFYLSGAIPYYIDALWESVSGFTTTGATILSEIENLPKSISLWRAETHWLGGMGIVALTVALFPLLGVGGFQLIKAETTGPEKGKFTPKITTTAKALWTIYILFTCLQVLLLKIAGMSFYDAVLHSFSTVGTGGFSSKNASIGAYNSVAIDAICTVFMFLAGINFSLYFYLLTGKIQGIRENTEFKAYVTLIFIFVLGITFANLQHYGGFLTSLRYSSFQTATIISTTGFATADYTFWPHLSQALIFFLFFIGGCSGSTSGGIKVIRWVVFAKQANNEFLKTLHPHGVFSIRLNNRAGRKDIVFNVAAFMTLYFMLLALTTIFGTAANLDLTTAFTGSLSMVGNVGPAFGLLGPSCNYGFLPSPLKCWYMFAMLAGRLELYTMIIFFFPDFYNK
ncbi:MAG: TrkH family potassium uptake protein [Treponema sp.]|nr:TrkH family potassium uptake protein [Treponema sp.]